MKYVVLAIALVASTAVAKPSHYCNPERSKPCGGGCIALAKTCRKPWTTAVSGVRPESSLPGFANPKFVENAPEAKTK